MSSTLVEQFARTSGRHASQTVYHVHSWRPWMSMYGLRLRPRGAAQSEVPQAPIQKLLPPELTTTVLRYLPITALAHCQCVCKQWNALGNFPPLWQSACQEAFQYVEYDKLNRLVRTAHKGSWRDLYLQRPHMRFDGVYVSRNTYLRTGLVEWRVKNPVHLVCYFRYYRFFPDGQFVYRTSPDVVRNAARSLQLSPGKSRADSQVERGLWRLNGSALQTVMVYANSKNTEIRAKLKLRSTTQGANNRLDIESIVSFDKADGISTPVIGSQQDGEEEQDLQQFLQQPGTRAHKRGTNPFVFVQWDRIGESELNLPVGKMDFYVPG
ncbi:hypothetical protein ABBQ38_014052 [Trebouxia sp. C0009 RCD-2024]